MPHVLVAGKLHSSGLKLLDLAKKHGYSYHYVEDISEETYAPHIGSADAVIIRTQPMSSNTIAAGTKLKIVSRHGVGYDSVDLPSLSSRKIALTIVGNVNSVSVAEHAMMQMLAAAKRLVIADNAVRTAGMWGWRNALLQQELNKKNLLILGYGRTGRHLASMANGFDMSIRAFDPYLQKTGWPNGNVESVEDLGEALQWADFISVHVPLGDRPTLGPKEFDNMKTGVILVNTSRGGVVDEVALAGALKSGKVGAAGFDVFEQEPISENSPLIDFEQAVLTPHIAGLTLECAERMAVKSVQNVFDFFDNKIERELVVNYDAIPDLPERSMQF